MVACGTRLTTFAGPLVRSGLKDAAAKLFYPFNCSMIGEFGRITYVHLRLSIASENGGVADFIYISLQRKRQQRTNREYPTEISSLSLDVLVTAADRFPFWICLTISALMLRPSVLHLLDAGHYVLLICVWLYHQPVSRTLRKLGPA